MKYISTVYYTNGLQIRGTAKKICKYCFNKGQKEIQKRVKQILSRLKTGWNIIVQDESIFVYDYVVRRKKWLIVDKRPIVTVTGSHKKTIVLVVYLLKVNSYSNNMINLTAIYC